MKENKKIVNVSLKHLLKRFSNSDVIANMEKEYRTNKPVMLSPDVIDDNTYLKRAKLNTIAIKKTFGSIETKGLASPIIVKLKKDHYEVILGRKRLIAAKLFKLDTIPCFVIEVSEEEMLLMIAADIRDSKNQNVVELSMICSRLSNYYGYSQTDLAKLLRISRPQLTNVIRISSLPDDVLLDVSLGKLSFGHAKTLLTLPDELIYKVVHKIYEDNLSVRDTEKVIDNLRNHTDYYSQEKTLSTKYKCQVDIQKKKITFSFKTKEEKDKFLSKMK